MKGKPLELRMKHNSGCATNCNAKERGYVTDEGLCRKTKSATDSLAVRCVGEWAYDKIYRLIQYFGIFSVGMKDKWGGNLHYLEICSGPGRCVIRKNGKELDGTPLAVMNHNGFQFIKNATFVDNNENVVNALNDRIKSLKKDEMAKAIIGDYNKESGIKIILETVSKKGLNLIFIDPTDCSVPFLVIRKLAYHHVKFDLIINIAIGTDVIRNIERALLKASHAKARTKYVNFLGSSDYFRSEANKKLARANKYNELKRAFICEYKKNLKGIGFDHIDIVPVKHFYYLMFVSKSPIGLQFWKKANKIEPNRQHTFLFS